MTWFPTGINGQTAYVMPYTILCIDDHEQGLFVRKLLLERRGHKVLTATSGKLGLNVLKQTPIDAVILDYRMKDMDGAAVAKMIRRKLPRMPILMLSAYTTELPLGLTRVVNSVIQKGEATSSLGQVLDDLLKSGNRNSQ